MRSTQSVYEEEFECAASAPSDGLRSVEIPVSSGGCSNRLHVMRNLVRDIQKITVPHGHGAVLILCPLAPLEGAADLVSGVGRRDTAKMLRKLATKLEKSI